MSRQNRLNGIALVLAVLIALGLGAANAKAIGLTPGRTTVDFEPNLEKTITFTIINNEHKEFKALVYVEGDLKDSVVLDRNIVDFKETDNSKEFQFKFRMPDKIDKPGEYWTKVVVMDMPAGMETGKLEGQVVIATTAVIHQVKVKVPYPGKYVDLEMAINEAEPGGTTMFFVKILNVGTENVYKAFATLDILGPTNEKIDTIESEAIAVESKNTGELVIPWVANVNPGVYHAVVTLNYDDKTAKIEKNFGVGALRIEVLDVKVRNFVLGGIAKFEINVENKWNQKIENVFAEMVINNQKGDQVASLKSASIDVESMQRATLYAYWDTEGVEKGAYDAKIILHYADKTAEKMLKTNVQLESIETEFVGITARAITAKGGPGPGADILVPLVLILVMINAGWFFYFRRRKK
jgi:hypothetical protein